MRSKDRRKQGGEGDTLELAEHKAYSATTKPGLFERRSAERFPLQLDVRYREMGRRSDCAQGIGSTKNVSGKGILFTTQHILRSGARVELSVDWPMRLDGKTPLRLVIQGRVVRSMNGHAVVMIQRHEFRTRSMASSA